MKIQKTEIDKLNARLNITIEQSDYEKDFTDQLKKQRSKVNLKGFRQGKTPLSVVKKFYGQQILADTVNKSLQNGLFDFIKNEKLDILGDPLPGENQEIVDFDPHNLKDFSFDFDIGISPDLQLKGIDATDTYELYDIKLEDKVLEEELAMARSRLGSQIEVEDNIEEKDILTLKALELEDGDLKKGGWKTGFTVMVDLIAEDKLRENVVKLKKGDTFDFDIYNLEKDKKEDYVKKYLLNLDEEEEKEIGNYFRATIEKIGRLKKADLDQEFFDKYFGKDEVKSELEAKNKIGERISKYYESQAKSLMYRKMLEALVEENKMELPDKFLKRWLQATNEKLEPAQLEKEFPEFQNNLKWTLIRGKIAKDNEIKVETEELQSYLRAQVAQYMGQYGMDPSFVDETVKKLMSDREQVNKAYEEVLSQKVFKSLEDKVNIEKKKIDLEKFKEEVTSLNKRLNAGV